MFEDEHIDDYYDSFQDMDVVDDDYSIYSHCISPILVDGITAYIAPILAANITLKLVLYFTNNKLIHKLLTIVIGLSLLLYHFRDEYYLFAIILIYIVFGTLVKHLAPYNQTINWFICLCFIAINETIILYLPSFMRIRAHIMLIIMKLISYNITEMGHNYYSILSYLLHPLSLLLGVWHPYHTYHPYQHSNHNQSVLRCVTQTFFYLIISLTFLLLSTCLVNHYLNDNLLIILADLLELIFPLSFVQLFEQIFTVYLTALQFRFSHYFICFAMQAMLCFWSYDLNVTNPFSIEMPRSLVDVVVAWNIPMHIWLKKNVFYPTKNTYGPFNAILLTYIVSSFLHGFNFQIWSVLLTLGILTKIEFDLRQKLSKIYDACIEVRRCQYEMEENQSFISRMNIFKPYRNNICLNAGHKYTEHNSVWVKIINLLFSLLAISHLAYLGSTFDGKEQSSRVSNVITVWYNLKFFSHITSIATFIFYISI